MSVAEKKTLEPLEKVYLEALDRLKLDWVSPEVIGFHEMVRASLLERWFANQWRRGWAFGDFMTWLLNDSVTLASVVMKLAIVNAERDIAACGERYELEARVMFFVRVMLGYALPKFMEMRGVVSQPEQKAAEYLAELHGYKLEMSLAEYPPAVLSAAAAVGHVPANVSEEDLKKLQDEVKHLAEGGAE